MSAADSVLETEGNIVLLDMSSFCDRFVTETTSRLNGAATKIQMDKSINDSVEFVTSGTMKDGAKKPELV